MKRKLMPYLLSYAFLFVSYLIISFIMAILFSFMHVSSFIYQLLITFFSYLILVVFTFIFYKMVKEKPLIHGMTLSMTYLIIQFIFHLKDINIQILIKPLFVFIIYYFSALSLSILIFLTRNFLKCIYKYISRPLWWA